MICLGKVTKFLFSFRISHSLPNVANSFWRHGRKKAIADQRTASSSPEHPLFRGHGRSLLGECRHAFREYDNDVSSSRSVVFNISVWLVNKQDFSIHNPEAFKRVYAHCWPLILILSCVSGVY